MDEPQGEFHAVFFDIGGVIVNLPSIRAGYAEYLEDFASERGLDPEEAADAWRERLGEHFKAAEGTEYRSAEDGYRKAFQHIAGEDLAEEEWRPDFEETLREARELEPHAAETIRALDDAGLYLGIVSDIDTAEAHRMLDDQGLSDAFDGITTSQAVGYKKPDERMFEDALAQAADHGVEPGRSLMVGDRYEHDMQGGSEAGLRTVAYNDAAEEVQARDGLCAEDEYVDFVVDDLAEILDIVGIER
jgi:putative hydrolase of the HAD superfamily